MDIAMWTLRDDILNSLEFGVHYFDLRTHQFGLSLRSDFCLPFAILLFLTNITPLATDIWRPSQMELNICNPQRRQSHGSSLTHHFLDKDGPKWEATLVHPDL